MIEGVGYVYILSNESYNENVLKVGFTKNLPDLRSKKIFSDGTGVPQPFNVVYACKVGDYKKAEKEIHNRLRSYRINLRREFFEIPLEICEREMLSVCTNINIELGLLFKNPTNLSHEDDSDDEFTDDNAFFARIDSLIPQESHVSILNEDQIQRVDILMRILKEVYPFNLERWLDGFMKDANPEREIKIWEAIAIAYLRSKKYNLSENHYNEVFAYLLMRTCSKKSFVMKQIKNNKLPLDVISKILDGYKLKPMPLNITREVCK